MSIINRIIQLLNEKGLTQKQLTDYLGIEKSTFSQWKAGKSQSYKKHIDKIAVFLDTTPSFLLGWDEWEEDVKEYSKIFDKKQKLLNEYLNFCFDDEDDRIIINNLLHAMFRLNHRGIVELKKRQDELCRLREYMSDSEIEMLDFRIREQAFEIISEIENESEQITVTPSKSEIRAAAFGGGKTNTTVTEEKSKEIYNAIQDFKNNK